MAASIFLAVLASFCTATASVTQRIAAAPAPGELSFSWRLVVYLVRRPIWFLGILAMIGGFALQMVALHLGQLSLVQPVIATELLFVFGFLALRRRHQVHVRDWIAAAGMAAGLAGFLLLAHPSGGSIAHATSSRWIGSGIVLGLAAVAMVLIAERNAASPARRAALLGVSAALAWGFVAAVVKELSDAAAIGPGAVFTSWSPYVLLAAGAAAFFLTQNAFQAGPLAASQPGLTVVDPLVASVLGVVVFDERVSVNVGDVAALVIVVLSVVLLARSPLIAEDTDVADPAADPEFPGRITARSPQPADASQ